MSLKKRVKIFTGDCLSGSGRFVRRIANAVVKLGDDMSLLECISRNPDIATLTKHVSDNERICNCDVKPSVNSIADISMVFRNYRWGLEIDGVPKVVIRSTTFNPFTSTTLNDCPGISGDFIFEAIGARTVDGYDSISDIHTWINDAKPRDAKFMIYTGIGDAAHRASFKVTAFGVQLRPFDYSDNGAITMIVNARFSDLVFESSVTPKCCGE